MEYRCQAYLAMTSRAKGLMWYGGSVSGGLFLAPKEGHWEALQSVASELHALSPQLMGATLPPPQVIPAGAPISVVMKQAQGRTILIAVNRSSVKAVDATLTSALLKEGKTRRLYEQQLLDATNGMIQDHFEPYAVHVYELLP
jgi:hypothetical protein